MPETSQSAYEAALGCLRAAMSKTKSEEIAATRDLVAKRYGPIFQLNNLGNLSKDDYISFLYIENNKHWSSLYRKGLQAASDMDKLRAALGLLLDESNPIAERFGQALDGVNGLGKGIATAILTVAYPDVYGVWNNTSESALRQMGTWPEFAKGESIGSKYAKVNSLLAKFKEDLETDFWTLDEVWWSILSPDAADTYTVEPSQTGVQKQSETASRFALEKQLQNFLIENWDRTDLANEWLIYSTKDDAEAGVQFPTDVGPIDILAVHRLEPKLLVIELKRNQSTDATVGQALRYIGWIEKHVAQPDGKSVQGLIISHKLDKAALYALSTVSHLKFMSYEIEFRLNSCQI